MAYRVHRPQFATFDQPPSWTNQAGNIDRAACMEVFAKDVWRRGIFRETPTANGRISTGIVILTADWLLAMDRKRRPRALSGDYRTAQANAMRPPGVPARRARRGLTPGVPTPYHDFGLHVNPNKGACRVKKLGVPDTWTHPLRVELWKLSEAITKRPFLICPNLKNCPPNCPSPLDWKLAGYDPRLPGLSTIARGSKLNMEICPQRVLKLFIVQCTEAELYDAFAAQTWIRTLPPGLRVKHDRFIGRLVQRYGLLFHPRRLMCQRCLGIKYNESPETIRRLRMRQAAESGKPKW